MLELDELVAVADRFGVAEEQVRRDHLISHVLASLPAWAAELVRGATGVSVQKYEFSSLPPTLEWQSQLGRSAITAVAPGNGTKLVRGCPRLVNDW